MHTKHFFSICIVIFLIFVACDDSKIETSNNSEIENTKSGGDTIFFGSISNVVQNEVLNYSLFMQYLSDSLKSVGVSYVDIKVVRSLAELIDLVNLGEVDLLTDSPYPVCAVMETTDMELFLKQYKAGVERYRTILFTRADSGIDNIKDLDGKLLGFEKPYSTSGFILPYISLANEGYKFSKVENILDERGKGKISYTFTGDDENTMYWVYTGKVDAGATDNISFNQNVGAKRDEMRIIYETEDVPRSILMINPKLSKVVKDRIHSVLLNMNKTYFGKEVMRNFFGTLTFEELQDTDIKSLDIFNKFKR